jgi:formate-dependent nitrite reductase membrane component NrfD
MLAGIFAFISLAGVTLPLLIPAGMSLVAYGRHAGEAQGRLADPVIAMICWVMGIACFIGPFILHQDPRCVSTTNGGSCSSDVVTMIEASMAIAGVALTLFTGWALSRPQTNHE